MVYHAALEELETTDYIIETQTEDVYGDYLQTQPQEWQDILKIRTFYEQRWLEEGKKIHYIRFRTPQ
jgi:hypothetical protein